MPLEINRLSQIIEDHHNENGSPKYQQEMIEDEINRVNASAPLKTQVTQPFYIKPPSGKMDVKKG